MVECVDHESPHSPGCPAELKLDTVKAQAKVSFTRLQADNVNAATVGCIAIDLMNE